ncbi:hypothetical protein LY28_01836 [Ruminiclostridium sufflavum DSM 19573]|uniref:Uncharacterized protein n=1 Tax=Ruminiclostridium sufflavum DSM 19573 TaxID=1121337 RepID=A0A318XK86_9FIRM|nr:hypothetical protein [Ruminiclostridium sufflavum]PYG87816.1 hypothetical protein LY28_01836 [Ruminiclostridium sufflavum DSM 19573]
MEVYELMDYLQQTQDYIEFSFYKNSSEIMEAIMKNGIEKVLNIVSIVENQKGIFECSSTWEVDESTCFSKDITINISGEMIFITEVLGTANNSSSTANTKSHIENIFNSSNTDVDIQKEYGEILSLLKSKPLNSIEKGLLTKVVAAFFR